MHLLVYVEQSPALLLVVLLLRFTQEGLFGIFEHDRRHAGVEVHIRDWTSPETRLGDEIESDLRSFASFLQVFFRGWFLTRVSAGYVVSVVDQTQEVVGVGILCVTPSLH